MHFLTNKANLPSYGNCNKNKQMTDKYWSYIQILLKVPKGLRDRF